MGARWSSAIEAPRCTTIVCVIVALCPLLCTLAAAAGDPPAGTDAGIALKPGVLLLARATGTASCTRDWPCSHGPDGSGAFACPATCAAPDLTSYALIGRVGGGPTMLLGQGELFLAFNDGDYTDNGGAFVVTLAFACASGASAGNDDGYRC